MKRNIEVTIAFKYEGISVSAVEKTHAVDFVTFFAASESYSDVKNHENFISRCKQSIEAKIGGKINKVNVIVQHHEKFGTNISVAKQKLSITNGVVSREDINNINSLLKTNNKKEGIRIIHSHPLQFQVSGVLVKNYNEAPIGKSGHELIMISSLSQMSNIWYKEIASIITSVGFSISQIFLSPQINISNTIDVNDIVSNKLLIHIGSHNSFIALSKNGGIAKLQELKGLSYSYLIKGIGMKFNCSKTDAQSILSVYGNLFTTENRVINEISSENKSYTTDNLTKVIHLFFKAIYKQIKIFLDNTNIKDLKTIVSGKIVHIDGIKESVTKGLNMETSLFRPNNIEYANKENFYGIGVLKLFNIIDMIFDNNIIKNIVDTNPESIDNIINKEQRNKRGFFAWLLGGKNAR